MPGSPDAHGYCADQCDTATDCTGADGVTSAPVCAAGECEYDCSGPGATCPSGMNCRDILPGIWRCRYID